MLMCLSKCVVLLQVTLDGTEVKLRFRFFSLYNKANLLPTSRTFEVRNLSNEALGPVTPFILSLEVLIANTRSPLKRVIKTDIAGGKHERVN